MGRKHYRILWGVAGLMIALWVIALRQFHLDDGAIYARVIEQWVETHVATFNTRDPTFPVTSRLWFAVNAPIVRALAVDDIYGYLRGASSVFYFASWPLFYLAVRRYIRVPYVVVGTTLLLVTDEIASEYGVSGMETALATFMAALNLYLFNTRLEGVAGGLAIVTRPENTLFVGLRLLDTARRGQGRSLLRYVVLCAMTAGPVALFVLNVSPSAPNTLAVKSANFELFTMFLPNARRIVLIMGAICAGPVIVLLSMGRRELFRVVREVAHEQVVQSGAIFAAGVLGVLSVLLNRDIIMARYFVIFIPFVYLSLGIVADRVVRAIGTTGVRWVSACGVNLLLVLTMGLANTRESSAAYQGFMRRIEVLRRHAKADDVYVGSAIGFVGYRTRLDVLDLVGLATPAAVPPNSEEECGGVLDLYEPDFIALEASRVASPKESVDWRECRVTFALEPIESLDVELFEGKYAWWGDSSRRRVTVYRIRSWSRMSVSR